MGGTSAQDHIEDPLYQVSRIPTSEDGHLVHRVPTSLRGQRTLALRHPSRPLKSAIQLNHPVTPDPETVDRPSYVSVVRVTEGRPHGHRDSPRKRPSNVGISVVERRPGEGHEDHHDRHMNDVSTPPASIAIDQVHECAYGALTFDTGAGSRALVELDRRSRSTRRHAARERGDRIPRVAHADQKEGRRRYRGRSQKGKGEVAL